MAAFVRKTMLLLCVLIVGVVLGIQHAENGMLSIQGDNDDNEEPVEADNHPFHPYTEAPLESHTQTPGGEGDIEDEDEPKIYVTRIDEDGVEYGIVTDTLTHEHIQAIDDDFATHNYSNRMSEVGNRVGDMIYTASQKGADWVVEKLEKLL